jgi:hypothetical protein
VPELAVNKGSAASPSIAPYGVTSAATTDIDDSVRPFPAGTTNFDIGADEYGAPPPAAPTPLPPVIANLLDDFNRAAALSLGSNWTVRATSVLFVVASPFRLVGLPDGTAISQAPGFTTWNPSTFGANQQAGVTLTTLPAATSTATISLILKASTATFTTGTIASQTRSPATYLEVRYSENQHTIRVGYATNNHTPTFPAGSTLSVDFDAGDRLSAVATGSAGTGTVQVFRNGVSVGTVIVNGWGASNNNAGGQVGLRYIGPLLPNTANSTKVDDFSGGNS